MVISYQSVQGHTTLLKLTDEQVNQKFDELTRQGYRAFADTRVAEPVGPIKTIEEARALNPDELLFVAPLTGG